MIFGEAGGICGFGTSWLLVLAGGDRRRRELSKSTRLHEVTRDSRILLDRCELKARAFSQGRWGYSPSDAFDS